MSAYRLRSHPILRKVLWTLLGLALLVGLALTIIAARIEPIVRERAVAALANRFDSDVTLPSLRVSLFGQILVRGESLTLRHHGRTDVPPLI